MPPELHERLMLLKNLAGLCTLLPAHFAGKYEPCRADQPHLATSSNVFAAC
jgi:hypothetical protein